MRQGQGDEPTRLRQRRAHADRSWTCYCGRTVWGNGGKSSHRRRCETFLRRAFTATERATAERPDSDYLRLRRDQAREQLRDLLLSRCPSCRGPLVSDVAEDYTCRHCGDEWDEATLLCSLQADG